MSEEKTKIVLRDIEEFCKEFQIMTDTFARRLKYPSLIERLQKGQRVKDNTIEKIYTEMELQRFKMDVKQSENIRQAVQAAHKFLRSRTEELT